MFRGVRESFIKGIIFELWCEGWVGKRVVYFGSNVLFVFCLFIYGGLFWYCGNGIWNIWVDMSYLKGGNDGVWWLNMGVVGN